MGFGSPGASGRVDVQSSKSGLHAEGFRVPPLTQALLRAACMAKTRIAPGML